MDRKLKLLFICFAFILLTSHSFAEVDLSELFENIHPAVATVITYDKNKKPVGQGSGFFIDAYGHLITNYHVLKGASHAEVRTYDGKRYPINSVIGEDRKMDLIKVLVDIPWSSVQWVNATGALPSIAERVIVIGSPMGLELTVSEGIVSSVREIPDLGKILQISAAISPGSSGGPVVNMKGQVIGIVSFYLIKGQNLNFAIPAQYIFDLKPSKTVKTISEWTYGVDKKTLRKTPRKGRLFVHTEPKGARVRILNIKPKFFQGIVLDPGRYNIEVSQGGYKTVRIWEILGDGENKSIEIKLSRLQAERYSGGKRALDLIDIYKLEVAFQVERHWAFSEQLAGDGRALQASLVFRVLPSGEVTNIRFTERSGNSYLDESAYKAIVNASPVSPHPEGARATYVTVALRFTPQGTR